MLRFYGPVNPMGPCGVWSVYLTTHLLGMLSPLKAVNQYCAHSFARNWQLPFLNQWKGKNDRRKYFMINRHVRMLPIVAGGWTRNLLVSSLTVHPTEPLRQAMRQWLVLCYSLMALKPCVFNFPPMKDLVNSLKNCLIYELHFFTFCNTLLSLFSFFLP